MAKEGVLEEKAAPISDFTVEITLSNPEREPEFRPIINKVASVIREATGKACQELITAKLRF